LFVILLVFLGLYFFGKSTWDGKSKLTVAVAKDNGDVVLVNFDPSTRFISSIKIPKNTQTTVTHELGIWQIGSVWELGFSEGYKGELLSSSAMKTFGIPVEAWSSGSFLNFVDGNVFLGLITRDTNLTLKDKIKLSRLILTTGSSAREKIDMEDTGFLESTTLPGGAPGYIVKSGMPKSLMKILF